MKPENDTKTQLVVALGTLLFAVGSAFGGQWVFDKCFKKKVQEKPKAEIESVQDSLRMQKINDALQKQK